MGEQVMIWAEVTVDGQAVLSGGASWAWGVCYEGDHRWVDVEFVWPLERLHGLRQMHETISWWFWCRLHIVTVFMSVVIVESMLDILFVNRIGSICGLLLEVWYCRFRRTVRHYRMLRKSCGKYGLKCQSVWFAIIIIIIIILIMVIIIIPLLVPPFPCDRAMWYFPIIQYNPLEIAASEHCIRMFWGRVEQFEIIGEITKRRFVDIC